jgi:CheY-like chemotaxis protein
MATASPSVRTPLVLRFIHWSSVSRRRMPVLSGRAVAIAASPGIGTRAGTDAMRNRRRIVGRRMNPPPVAPLRVLVIDDHAGFRTAARRLLESDGFEVVGEAADAASGVVFAGQLRPDVILLDVGLPDADGIDVARTLDRVSDASVVLISSRDRSTYEGRLDGSPSVGFIAKDDLREGRLRAVLGERST